MPYKRNLFFALTTILLSTTIQADTLRIPGHLESESTLNMPRRGINMDAVLEQFGEPDRRIEAIGEPPITEWDYGDFSVFFEHQTVLHSLNLKTLIMPK
ncbi:MAG: hypothetical protein KAU21_04600 [Gammaproteobacteria bacterium]|nr:hypothetical protein [Gammaproteobacteria bacterium]